MGRRRSAPWAATSVPAMRAQWSYAIDAVCGYDEVAIAAQMGFDPAIVAGSKRMQRLSSRLAEHRAMMRAEAGALRGAQMYWVSRDMVDVVLGAARSLPEWSPGVAAPSRSGLLCWAKSAGEVPTGVPGADDVDPDRSAKVLVDIVGRETIDVPWDAVFWWTRPDGVMQLQPCSREVSHVGLLSSVGVSSPLWGAHSIFLDPAVVRTEEVHHTERAYPFVSAVGAAWLLMAQANVAATRVLGDRGQSGGDASAEADTVDSSPGSRPSSTVTIVDLRARETAPRAQGESGRRYSHRWQVQGHWRQQPCGPNNAQRRPRFIADYVKGPAGAPLVAKDRVHVLRK